jgi:type IV secretory pathway TrbD component
MCAIGNNIVNDDMFEIGYCDYSALVFSDKVWYGMVLQLARATWYKRCFGVRLWYLRRPYQNAYATPEMQMRTTYEAICRDAEADA